MLEKFTSVLLIVVLMAPSSIALVADQRLQQTVPEMRRVASAAVEKNKQVNVVLKTKRNGRKKLSGTPRGVSEEGLTLMDTKLGQESRIEFDDIREIRTKPSHVWLIVGVGAAVGLAIAVLVGLHAAANRS